MIKLVEINEERYLKIWPHLQAVNLLQSYSYGKVLGDLKNLDRLFLEIVSNNKTVGIISMHLKKIPFLGFAANISRFPALSRGQNLEEIEEILPQILDQLKDLCRAKRIFFLRISPEIPNNFSNKNILKNKAFRKTSKTEWASGRILLRDDEEKILMSLNGKWRNCYRKAVKNNIQIKIADNNDKNISSLVSSYTSFVEEKGFEGLSGDLVRSLFTAGYDDLQLNIFEAFNEEKTEIIGRVVTVNYGKEVMYLIGMTNDLGRKLNANYLLLWESIKHAKQQKAVFFDVGGLNKDTTEGISHFKKGLNSKKYELIGEWITFLLPRFLK